MYECEERMCGCVRLLLIYVWLGVLVSVNRFAHFIWST